MKLDQTNNGPAGQLINHSASASEGARLASMSTSHNPFNAGEHQKTRGEKWFHRIVHTGINFIFNSVSSVVFTEWWKYGKHKDHFNKWRDKVGSAYVKLPFVDKTPANRQANIEKGGELGMSLFALSLIGWALLLPIGWLKNNELKLVKWLDKKFDKGHSLSEGDRHQREIAYAAIAAKPKQTIGSMIKSRLSGLAINYGTFYGIKYGSELLHKGGIGKGRNIENYTKLVADKSGEVLGKWGILKDKWVAYFQHIADLSLVEIISCGITAIGFARIMDRRDKKHVAQHSAIPAKISNDEAKDEALLQIEDKTKKLHASRYMPANSHVDAALRPQSIPALNI